MTKQCVQVYKSKNVKGFKVMPYYYNDSCMRDKFKKNLPYTGMGCRVIKYAMK